MKPYKPVAVPRHAFAFCRYSLAALVWLSLIFRIKPLMIAVLLIFLLSALLKVKRAPMIVLFSWTIGRFAKSADEIVNEHAMRFAHILGSLFSSACLLLLYYGNERAGWGLVFIFAVFKSISAFGFCPAGRLYECAAGGSCCAFAKKNDRPA